MDDQRAGNQCGEPEPEQEYVLSAVEARGVEPSLPPMDHFRELADQAYAPKPERIQISVGGLMLTVTVAAVLLGLIRTIPGAQSVGAMAGWFGLAILVTALVFSLIGPLRPEVRYCWWVLFALYLMLVLMAVIKTIMERNAS